MRRPNGAVDLAYVERAPVNLPDDITAPFHAGHERAIVGRKPRVIFRLRLPFIGVFAHQASHRADAGTDRSTFAGVAGNSAADRTQQPPSRGPAQQGATGRGAA